MENRSKTLGEIMREDIVSKIKLFKEITSWKEEDYMEYEKLLEEFILINKKKDKKDEMTTRKKGDVLEDLVNFIICKSFILSVYPNIRTSTNEIDQFIVLNDNGKQAIHEYNFSKELMGFKEDYFLAECKNYNKKVNVTWVSKFYSLLKVAGNSELGIIFSYEGLTGKDNAWYEAHGLTKIIYRIEKIENNREMFILDFNINDFKELKNKKIGFFDIIKMKKESLRSCAKSEILMKKHEGISFVKETVNEISSNKL
ncbi:acetylglutamate semialdehyde dehydrogenase [Clostridium botulinum]|nr:acetylglutamate semialdehyde dehydrogenase [Clostridium botulinum]